MVTITAPDYSKTAGIPGQWDAQFGVTPEGFIVGDTPAVVTEDLIFAANQTILARTLVGFNASKQVVPASLAEGAVIVPIGFTVVDVVTTTAGGPKGAPIYRAGVFNPDLAVWPASYTTAAQKISAFHGAPTPTNIIMRRATQKSVPQP